MMAHLWASYRFLMPLLRFFVLIAALLARVNCLPTPANVPSSAQSATTTSSPERRAVDGTSNPLGALGKQWQNPSDLSSVLMIIGGDIVQVRASTAFFRTSKSDSKSLPFTLRRKQ